VNAWQWENIRRNGKKNISALEIIVTCVYSTFNRVFVHSVLGASFFSAALVTRSTLGVNVTKPCRYLDFERGNATLHIFGFLVNQKKLFLIAFPPSAMQEVLFCSIYYCFQLFKIPVTILTGFFSSSLAIKAVVNPYRFPGR